MWAKHKQTGFTIVELLIVIVVISVLAAITIVTYSGAQQRANNGKTTSSLNIWIKALTLYKIDESHWPSGLVCLGEGYLYGVSGTDTSGTAQCRQDTAGSGFLETSSFVLAMKPYVGGGTLPTPAFITASTSDAIWRRGLSYYFGGGDGTQVYITAAFAGSLSGGCPIVSGFSGSLSVMGANSSCVYVIGHTSDT